MNKSLLFLFFTTTLAFGQKVKQVDIGFRSVKVIKKDGLEFKDLNKNGKLDKYEDWRLATNLRIKDLVSQMTLEEKAGFMLISTTRMAGDGGFVPMNDAKIPITNGFNEEDLVQSVNMFTRKPLAEPQLSASGTSKGVKERNLRHFILRANTSSKTIAEWSNNLQTLCESTRLGIPAIVASNPRNHITTDAAVGLSVGSTAFSKWPGELGMAAMRDFKLTQEFAEIAAKEWKAVGLRKGYMYMADLATEPRWNRTEGTFGEDAELSSNMIKAIILGFQGKKLNSNSIAMTTKHFPGGGPQEEGQDSHFDWGKFAHYPGANFDYHLKPFIAAIAAGTSSIMPYYSAPKGKAFEEVGFSFNKPIVNDLLKKKLGYTGIINSDTGPIDMMPWGVENLSIEQRYIKALEAGVDIFSGSADPAILINLVNKGLVNINRINESVSKLLKEKFDLGLFENPYVDPEMASKVVGNAEFQQKADLALRKSIVLLRNEQKQLPLSPKTKVYFESFKEEAPARGQQAAQPLAKSPNKVLKLANSNSNLIFVDTKEEADVVVLWLFPTTGGLFSSGGKPIELGLSKNKIDVNYVNNMIENKPTIVAINFTNPWVIDELKLNKTKGFLATFGTSAEALADVISGKFNPSGKMPFATPSSDKAVSENKSDLPGSAENPGYALFNFGEGLRY
jgi:beta-glucosidase